MITPGFISRAFLIQRARCGASFGIEPAGDRVARRDVREVRADHPDHHRIAVDRVTGEASAGALHERRAVRRVALAASTLVVEVEARRQRRFGNRVRRHLVARERDEACLGDRRRGVAPGALGTPTPDALHSRRAGRRFVRRAWRRSSRRWRPRRARRCLAQAVRPVPRSPRRAATLLLMRDPAVEVRLRNRVRLEAHVGVARAAVLDTRAVPRVDAATNPACTTGSSCGSVTTSRLPDSAGTQNEWMTSFDWSVKFTVLPIGQIQLVRRDHRVHPPPARASCTADSGTPTTTDGR